MAVMNGQNNLGNSANNGNVAPTAANAAGSPNSAPAPPPQAAPPAAPNSAAALAAAQAAALNPYLFTDPYSLAQIAGSQLLNPYSAAAATGGYNLPWAMYPSLLQQNAAGAQMIQNGAAPAQNGAANAANQTAANQNADVNQAGQTGGGAQNAAGSLLPLGAPGLQLLAPTPAYYDHTGQVVFALPSNAQRDAALRLIPPHLLFNMTGAGKFTLSFL